MKKANLVVLTGYPHSGKTEVAKFLVKKRFVRLELDQMRRELFGYGFPKVNEKQEREARLTLQYRKLDLLSKGNGVIVDSCSATNIDRLENLLLPDSLVNKVNRYLIYLKVDRKILVKRNLEDKARDKKLFRKVFKDMDKHWEEPRTYSDKQGKVKIINFENNSKIDLERIEKSLLKEFTV